jgi:MFS family permease
MISAMRHQPTSEPDAARIAQGRLGVMGLFVSLGMMITTLLSRLPSIRDELGVTKGQLSFLLITGAVGALVALMLTGWAVARFGTRRLHVWSSISYAVAFVGVGVSSHLGLPMAFALFQLVATFSFAFTNVAINAEAALTERLIGRKIMPHFHAGFAIGMATGIAVGGLASMFGVPPIYHFAVVAGVLLAARLVLIPIAVTDGRPLDLPEGARLGGPFAMAQAEFRDPRILMIGAIVFAASMTEGTAAQWIAISGVDDFGRSESTGDLMYWIFVVSIIGVRLIGPRLLERFGRVAVLRVSAGTAVAGILTFAFTPWFALVPVALVLWGAGAALGFPIGFSAAADERSRAAARVAAVSSFATVAGLVIPAAIGHLADATTTRHALLLVILGSITSFTFARAVRPDERLFKFGRRRSARVELESAATAIAVAPSDTGTTLGA